MTDRLYRGLDALKGLCKQALGEEVLGIDIVQVAEDLKGEKITSTIKDSASPETSPMEKSPAKETKQSISTSDSPKPKESAETIESVPEKKPDTAPKPAVVEKVQIEKLLKIKWEPSGYQLISWTPW